jgi:proteasome lid subunit RPN8/RPN11
MKIHTAPSLFACLEIISEHAVRSVPFECCGIILGNKAFPLCKQFTVFECTNIQNDLHANNPDQFVRDARFAYYIHPVEQQRIFKEAHAKKLVPTAFYHSHVNHEVYFSEEDRKRALWCDEPLFPDTSYIVISVLSGYTNNIGVFTWNASERLFDETKMALL